MWGAIFYLHRLATRGRGTPISVLLYSPMLTLCNRRLAWLELFVTALGDVDPLLCLGSKFDRCAKISSQRSGTLASHPIGAVLIPLVTIIWPLKMSRYTIVQSSALYATSDLCCRLVSSCTIWFIYAGLVFALLANNPSSMSWDTCAFSCQLIEEIMFV